MQGTVGEIMFLRHRKALIMSICRKGCRDDNSSDKAGKDVLGRPLSSVRSSLKRESLSPEKQRNRHPVPLLQKFNSAVPQKHCHAHQRTFWILGEPVQIQHVKCEGSPLHAFVSFEDGATETPQTCAKLSLDRAAENVHAPTLAQS